MSMHTNIAGIESQLFAAREAAHRFLTDCEQYKDEFVSHYDLPVEAMSKARSLSKDFHGPLIRLSRFVRRSAMLGELDLKVIQRAIHRIDAALRLRQHVQWDPEILNDEDVVLGVRPAGFSEDRPLTPRRAQNEIDSVLDQVNRLISILHSEAESDVDTSPFSINPTQISGIIRPGTAFIMMMFDPSKPDLDDVKHAIKDVCAKFSIRATRADEIEHSDEITARILTEIRTSEFLIADLSGERPSVYYEVGYAHAIGRRPILYRKSKTKIHFDLSVHNCPEYKNLRELSDKLEKRLKAIIGRE